MPTPPSTNRRSSWWVPLAVGLAVGFAVTTLGSLVSCGKEPPPPARPPKGTSADITQIMVRYRVEGRSEFPRSRGEALKRARDILTRAKNGVSFETLVEEETDDRNEAGKPFNDGSYTVITSAGGPAMRAVVEAIRSTPVGSIHPEPLDTGLAFLVFRRDR